MKPVLLLLVVGVLVGVAALGVAHPVMLGADFAGLMLLLPFAPLLGAQLTGQVILAAGKSLNKTFLLGYMSHDPLDDALGGAASVYINGVNKPANQGTSWPLNARPASPDIAAKFGSKLMVHVLGGENLYTGLNCRESGKTFDSDDAGNVFDIKILQYNADGTTEQLHWSDIEQRNKEPTTGGITDDRTVTKGVDTLFAARGPCPTGSNWRLYGAVRLKFDDTAA